MSGVKVFDGSWVFDLVDREDPVKGGTSDDCLVCLSILSLKQYK